jgi:hypothetical protein
MEYLINFLIAVPWLGLVLMLMAACALVYFGKDEITKKLGKRVAIAAVLVSVIMSLTSPINLPRTSAPKMPEVVYEETLPASQPLVDKTPKPATINSQRLDLSKELNAVEQSKEINKGN